MTKVLNCATLQVLILYFNSVWLENFFSLRREELNLENSLVPERELQFDSLDFEEDKFLKITVSSAERDGGQTTIPYIDLRDVAPKQPIALSRVAFAYRGKPGYGGQIGLKAYSYDLSQHVEDHFNLTDSSLLFALKFTKNDPKILRNDL